LSEYRERDRQLHHQYDVPGAGPRFDFEDTIRRIRAAQKAQVAERENAAGNSTELP
jgi:hypothetical protein